MLAGYGGVVWIDSGSCRYSDGFWVSWIFISSDNAQSVMCAVGGIHHGLKVLSCFMHVTTSHYHHYADLPTCIEHIRWKIWKACLLDISCGECVLSSLGYLPYFLRKMWGYMVCTGPSKFRWSRWYIHNSSYYHHQIGSINLFPLSYCSVDVCLRWLYHHMLSVAHTHIYTVKNIFLNFLNFLTFS